MGNRRGPYKGRAEYSATTAAGYGAAWQVIRRRILARDRNTCHYCGEYADTVDHVVPKVRGGSDGDNNLVAACGSCNYSKGDGPAPRRRAKISPRPAPDPARSPGWYPADESLGYGPCSRKWHSDLIWIE